MRFKWLILLTLLACALHTALAQTSTTGSKSMSIYHKIELKAQKADPGNRQSIHDLVHEVMVTPHLYQMSDPIASLVEDRLTDSEINFRNNNGHKVNERQVVDLLNWMVERFGLPSYLKTTETQVRTLRMKLLIAAPVLMGYAITGKEIEKGGHIRADMSPVQAMHLLNVMVDQKVMNPDYQDPSIDIASSEQERAKTLQLSSSINRVTGTRIASVSANVNPKSTEVRRKLSDAF